MALGLGLGFAPSSAALTPSFSLTNPSNQWLSAASITGFDATKGTCVLDFTITVLPAAGSEVPLWIGNDSGANDGIFLQLRTSPSGTKPWRFISAVNSSTLALLDKDFRNFNVGKHRLAMSYIDSQLIMVLDGVLIGSTPVSSGFLPLVMDGISIGTIGDTGTQNFSGTMQKFDYYPDNLSLSQCRALTRNNLLQGGVSNDPLLRTVVFQGQSNSSGRSTGSPSYTNTSLINLITNQWTLTSYTDPYDVNTSNVLNFLNDSSGPDVGYAGFAIDDLAGDTSDEWCALPANKSSTTALGDWSFENGSTGFDETAPNVGFSAIQQTKLAVEFGVLEAVIFHLGESDAIAGTASAAYKASVTNYINEMRAAIGFNIPVIFSSLHAYDAGTTATEANWDRISADNLELGTEISNASGVDISDLVGIVADRVHMAFASNGTAGPRYSTAIQALI